MSLIAPERLIAALDRVATELESYLAADGSHWQSRLSASALSTATAVSAMALVLRHLPGDHSGETPEPLPAETGFRLSRSEILDMGRRIREGVTWLLRDQNDDGGWGDTDRSGSNISTTVLVKAALHLVGDTGVEELERADTYLSRHGGLGAIRERYGDDKTFSAPILTNAALAGFVSWDDVPALPFELAALPQSFFRFLRLPVVSYAVPALVAVGQCKAFHAPPRNPLARILRRALKERTLVLVERMQPTGGGFLEAAPLTAFVAMSLAAVGHAKHPVVTRAVRFLLKTVRADGAWPIDTNLDCWVTSLSVVSSAAGGAIGSRSPGLLRSRDEGGDADDASDEPPLLRWLLSCQHRKTHPFTGAKPGGWGWTNLDGAVPDADDTAGALLALATFLPDPDDKALSDRWDTICNAATAGLRWLMDLQNHNGGFPTFCRGWGKLPFDRSSVDLTAHAVRALYRWAGIFGQQSFTGELRRSIDQALDFLAAQQQSDGRWLPLWFGNEHMPDDENPFYGTAKVLRMFADLDDDLRRPHEKRINHAIGWLLERSNDDGGWGGDLRRSSVEETALIVESLTFFRDRPGVRDALVDGLRVLVDRVEDGSFIEPSPIGLYFAKLWYYEELYPRIFTLAALRGVLDFETQNPETT